MMRRRVMVMTATLLSLSAAPAWANVGDLKALDQRAGQMREGLEQGRLMGAGWNLFAGGVTTAVATIALLQRADAASRGETVASYLPVEIGLVALAGLQVLGGVGALSTTTGMEDDLGSFLEESDEVRLAVGRNTLAKIAGRARQERLTRAGVLGVTTLGFGAISVFQALDPEHADGVAGTIGLTGVLGGLMLWQFLVPTQAEVLGLESEYAGWVPTLGVSERGTWVGVGWTW